jgi:hypothetical protein
MELKNRKIMEFKCFDCHLVFEGEGTKVDYMDPIYGACSKIIAVCPVCGSDCTEYRKPKPAKSSGASENSCPSYQNGSCSCCN